MTKVIIFDFDDTITDNSDLDYNSFQYTSKKLKIDTPNKNEIIKLRKRGLMAKEIVKKHLKKIKKEEILLEYLEIRRKFLHNNSVEHLILKKNFKKLLNYLKKKKVKIIICSANNNKTNVLEFLQNHNIKNKFFKILFMNNLGFQIQNDTKSNRLLIKSSLLYRVIKMDLIRKNEILFIGNSIEDKMAAKRNKICFVHYQNKYLPKIKNKKIIYSMNELHIMIKKMGF